MSVPSIVSDCMRPLRLRLLNWLCAGFFCLPSLAAAEPAQRIVSLDLCTDWMLVRYASPSQVLALSPLHRQYPVDWVTPDWPVHDGSLEMILELKPDLVITGEYNALMLRRRLSELGLRVEILALPQNLKEVDRYQQQFLRLLGQSYMSSQHDSTEINSANAPRLLLLGANGIATGRNTFENDVLRQAGWQNYLTDQGYLRLDLEQVINDPPDAILWSSAPHAALANRFAEHPVLKKLIANEQWLQTDYWRWQCPGPWTLELTGQLKQQLKSWQTY